MSIDARCGEVGGVVAAGDIRGEDNAFQCEGGLFSGGIHAAAGDAHGVA